ncbi:S41 family peptidase [Sandarakinorhabdus oryzae]|uniref:S41 family peptidase n=1 Tax=Sandarakinorhabdus oryzae TaxID=2675220 RepID=UPI0012E28988|nr:S41 family peptidase [Sandarakinorhabdus oryzae]
MRCSVLLAALLATTANAAEMPNPMLTPAQATRDVALMRRALETIHPGLTRYVPKAQVDAGFARLEALARQPIATLTLHREIARLVASIHCDHSKPELPDAIESWRQTNASHLPFRFRLIEGRMIVLSGALPKGAEVTAINGRPVPQILTAVAPLVAYDGDTDQAVAVKIADDSDLGGSDLEEYWPGLFGAPQQWDIAWKMPGAAVGQTSQLAPISFTQWRQLEAPDGKYRNEFYSGISWHMAGKTARLKIDTFVNYRNPVAATPFMGGFFQAMKAAGTEHLILDLRNNGGGSTDPTIALGRHLLDAPFTLTKSIRAKTIRFGDLPNHIETWGNRDAQFNPPESAYRPTGDGLLERIPTGTDEGDDDDSQIMHQPLPADQRFTGRLTVLTGPQNGSGATMTIAWLKDKRAVTLVGEDTSGSAEGPTAGNIFNLVLPESHIRVRVPQFKSFTNIKAFTPRRGVATDVLVVPTLADFEAGRDRVVEVARALDQPAAPLDAAATLTTALAGNWAGTLDYRDYGNDGRVTLPTLMSAKGLTIAWTFDDGPGKTVRASEAWSFSPDGKTLSITSGKARETMAVVELRRSPAGAVTLVADGRGNENGQSVMVRTILTRDGHVLRLTRMSRSAGQPLIMRHSYQLRAIA